MSTVGTQTNFYNMSIYFIAKPDSNIVKKKLNLSSPHTSSKCIICSNLPRRKLDHFYSKYISLIKDQEQELLIRVLGESGSGGAMNDELIMFKPLWPI